MSAHASEIVHIDNTRLLMKRFLVARKDSFDGNVKVLALVNEIKIGKRNVFVRSHFFVTPTTGGGLNMHPFTTF